MMRDHTKLAVYHEACDFAVDIYKLTQNFPDEEKFGLKSQMRRAVVSISSNIVEGCAHKSAAEYMRFIEIAYASAREVTHQVVLSQRLGFVSSNAAVIGRGDIVCKMLAGILKSIKASEDQK